jgi:hypothetical protein
MGRIRIGLGFNDYMDLAGQEKEENEVNTFTF